MVYLIEDEGQRFLKIGFSANPRSRLSTIHVAAKKIGLVANRFRLLSIMEGSREKERSIQDQFAHLSAGTRSFEWFHHHPDIINLFSSMGVSTITGLYPMRGPQLRTGRPYASTSCGFCEQPVNGSAELRKHWTICPKRK